MFDLPHWPTIGGLQTGYRAIAAELPRLTIAHGAYVGYNTAGPVGWVVGGVVGLGVLGIAVVRAVSQVRWQRLAAVRQIDLRRAVTDEASGRQRVSRSFVLLLGSRAPWLGATNHQRFKRLRGRRR